MSRLKTQLANLDGRATKTRSHTDFMIFVIFVTFVV
jgi:hypothetical protein